MARLRGEIAQERAAIIPEALRAMREGESISVLSRRLGIPRRTLERWRADADITHSTAPDSRARLNEMAWLVAVECVKRASEALPEATSYEATRSAKLLTDIGLDLTEGRKGQVVNINDNRDQRSITLAGAPTEGLLQLAEAIERMAGDDAD